MDAYRRRSVFCSACRKGRCPVLYVLYTAELETIVVRHDQRLHMYADDCQVYLGTSVEDVCLTVSRFAACIVVINAWLSGCRLRLNAAKTQLLWLGSSQLLDKVDCLDVLVLGTFYFHFR